MKLALFYVKDLDESTFSKIIEGLKDRKLTKKVQAGFIFEEIREDHFVAKYIEKMVSENEIEDPFGNTFINRFVLYPEIQFHVDLNLSQLTIFEPNKYSKNLIPILGDILEYNTVIEPVFLDLNRVLNAKTLAKLKVKLTAIVIDDLIIDKTARARVQLSSETNLTAHLQSFTRKAPYQIKKIVLERLTTGEDIRIEITASGRISVSCEDYLEAIKHVSPLVKELSLT
jgi:hypothetical protein